MTFHYPIFDISIIVFGFLLVLLLVLIFVIELKVYLRHDVKNDKWHVMDNEDTMRETIPGYKEWREKIQNDSSYIF